MPAAYMEKLCQNVWRLPAVQDPGKVLHGLLVKTVKSDHIRGLIWDAVRDMRCLPPNPRRIKGLANLIGRLSPRLQAELNDFPAEVNGLPEGPDKEAAIKEAAIIKARILVIVAYIYQFHADIYVRWEAELDLYDKIFDWCGGAESHSGVRPVNWRVISLGLVQADQRVSCSQERLQTHSAERSR